MYNFRQAVAPQAATSPYIQQLYAASANPYGQVTPNIMQLMQGSTGNPLLDMYGQYAAMGYQPAAAPAAVSQAAVMPAVTQSISLDASQQAQAQAQAVAGKIMKIIR